MANGDYVFLSYSHSDSIQNYCDILEQAGYSFIFDESLSYGEEWNLKVRRQISNSKCKGLILFMSEKTLTSNSILTEIEYAQKYSKPYMAVLLKSDEIADIFNSAIKRSDDDQKFIIESMSEYFPQNKLYIKANEFHFDKQSKLENTLADWGIKPAKKQESDYKAALYSSEILGEKERLRFQADGYVDFDRRAIDRALSTISKEEIVVLDLGCSDGFVTYTRFADNPRIKKVIGVDYNENDINAAKERYKNDKKFSFYTIDLNEHDFPLKIKKILKEQHIDGIDLAFAAFIVQHVIDQKLFLLRLFDLFTGEGKLIIRESDDGCKIGYPQDGLMEEIMHRSNLLIKSSDRLIGRKLYSFLCELGYNDIQILYQIDDTINKSRKEKEWLFTMGFSFRLNRIRNILNDNPDNRMLQTELAWLESAVERLKSQFFSNGFYYSARSFIAIAGV